MKESRQAAIFTQAFDKLLKKQTKGKQPSLKDLEKVFGLMRKRHGELSGLGIQGAFESVNEVSGVDLAKKVLKNKQYEKGLDLQTANLIIKIHKAYDKNPELQKKFEKIPLPKMKQLIMKYYS